MKISSPYPTEINTALKDNLPTLEFTDEAEITLPALALPVRIGEIIDYIDFAMDKNIFLGNFCLDTSKNILKYNSKNLGLTDKETVILKYLAAASKPVSRDEMLQNIWGYSDTVDSKTVENHIYRLRQKITATFNVELIITESDGYKLIEN